MKERQPAVYIMTNKYRGTLYTGVTSNLAKRVYEHKFSNVCGFTRKYSCKKLVYYELAGDMYSAISQEKRIKSGSRDKKIALIEKYNPEWHDLYETLF